MVPLEANQKILEALSASEGPVTLGLLPLSAEEEADCIHDVVECCNGRLSVLIRLLEELAPAAAAYAIAAGASQAVTEGRQFWQPASEKLGIPFDPNDREKLSWAYRKACLTLGVVDPDVSAMTWRHVAPMMAQASILHAWVDSLANGLQSTIRHRPLPDLEDVRSLEGFSHDLAKKIHHQQNLKKVLCTEVGPVVTHRLISSCVYEQFEILPAHLRQPIQAAMQGAGRQVSLKSPYAGYSIVDDCFELILPKQPDSLVTHNTMWLVNDIQYSPLSEHHLSEHEVGKGSVNVVLHGLDKGFEDQEFSVYLGLRESLRVFDQHSLRERKITVGGENELVPSDYLVVMKPECRSNDEEAEESSGSYRILQQVSMRPGWEPLEVLCGDEVTILCPALKAGIYQSSDEGLSTLLVDGKRLHYGDAFGFLAYIPKNQHAGSVSVRLSSRDGVEQINELELQSEREGGYDYSRELEDLLRRFSSSLTSGIHPIKIEVNARAASVTRELWYWKGLTRISQLLGFDCSEIPGNIKFQDCKGIIPSDRGCSIPDSYHAPRLVIGLDEGERLEIARPGVRAVSLDREDDWRTDLTGRESLTISERDRRIVIFQSGGFENWSLQCNGREFAHLDERRTEVSVSLLFFLSEFGQSGTIEAKNDSGKMVRMFRFASDLVSKPLELKVEHGRKLRHWKTFVPSEKLVKLGVRVSDYTLSPVPSEVGPVTVYEGQAAGDNWEIALVDGIRLQVAHQSGNENEAQGISLDLEIEDPEVSKKLLLIELLTGGEDSEHWETLRCDDGANTSSCVIAYVGSEPYAEGYPGFWPHMWRVSKSGVDEDGLSLYQEIDSEGVSATLETISRFISIKFPGAVFVDAGKFLSTYGNRFASRRRALDQDDASCWWNAVATELQNHASATTTPVIRQFLLGSNSSMLTKIWSQECEGGAEFSGLVSKSLFLVNDICGSGGRVPYCVKAFPEGRHPADLYGSFENSHQVMSGTDDDFSDFDFDRFFDGIIQRAVSHFEDGTEIEGCPILSARHLLHAIRSLNRRTRVLARASEQEAGELLAVALQRLAEGHNEIERVAQFLNRKVDYTPAVRNVNLAQMHHFDSQYFPDLPAMGGRQAKQIADITWTLCLLTRARAYRIINSDEYSKRIYKFMGGSVHENLINHVLSFAPELYAYYTALLDFALYDSAVVDAS